MKHFWELNKKTAISRATVTAATATASTALIAAPTTPGRITLLWVKGVGSAAGSVTFAWATAAGSVAYYRPFPSSWAFDEMVFDRGPVATGLVLKTAATPGNCQFEVYYTVETGTGLTG